jgi:hypothetical protein
MRRSAVVGMMAGCVALSGCTRRCPAGQEPVTSTYRLCDDRTRECTDYTNEYCACVGRDCPHVDAGPVPAVCLPALSGTGDWEAQAMTGAPHVVDGQFTGSEWEGATKLEGLFTDVYMDYRDGRLYFLNDWRANDEGIRADCYNYFQVRIGDEWIDLRVFGNGEVQVHRDDVPVSISAEGAYGFGASPDYPTAHTIYEFSLAVDVPEIVVCCIDPLLESSCEDLTQEPMAVSIRLSGGGTQVRRQLAAGAVTRLGPDAACGDQEGICADGLGCDGARHVCVLPTRPHVDAGDVDAGAPF